MLKICKKMGELRREDLRNVEIVAKLQMQWDKKRQNCRLLKNLRAELPMETQMAADVFPQVRQRSAKVVRTRVRTFAQMAAEDVRRYVP